MVYVRKLIPAVLIAGAVSGHAAVDGYTSTSLSSAAQGSGGSWTDSATWNPSGEPADNARITLSYLAACNPVLTLGEDVTREYRLIFFNAYGKAGSISLDGKDKTLSMPYSSEGYYEKTAFNVCDGTRYLFQVTDTVDDGKNPVLKWTDPLFGLCLEADNSRCTVRFDRGTFDFRDVSTGGASRPVKIANHNVNGTRPATVRVGSGANLIAGEVTYYGAVDGDELVFDGGTGDFTSLFLSSGNAASITHSCSLTVTNGGVLATGSFSDTHTATETSDVEFRINLSDSTLAVTNGDFHLAPSAQAVTVLEMDGSTLAVTNGVAKLGGSASSAHTVNVVAADSAFLIQSPLRIGAATGTGGLGLTTFAATDTLFDVYNFNVYAGATALFDGAVFDYSHNPGTVTNVMYNGSRVTVKGSSSVTDLGNLTVGERNPNDTSNTDLAVLTLDGGEFTMGTAVDQSGVGLTTGANGLMVLTNGANLTVTGDGRFTVGDGGNAHGRLEISDSTFEFAASGYFVVGDWGATGNTIGSGYLRVGNGGVLRQTAGTFTLSRYCVPATFELCEGGKAELGNVYMEYNTFGHSNPLVTNRLIQTGGELSMNTLELVKGGNRCEAYFLGGVTRVSSIIAGEGLRTGKAPGCVYADGGTLVPVGSTDNFIKGLTSFEIGGNGLLIDTTDRTLGIRQDISDMPGESGVLTVTGGGIAVIAPTNVWTVSKTVARGVTIAFTNETTVLEGELELGYASVLSLAGTASTLELGGFKAGYGVLLLDPGDVIKVPASGLDLGDFTVSYVSEPEVDVTNSIFEITGEISDADVLALVTAFERGRTPGSSDEIVVGTAGGVTSVRTVRRTPAAALSAETAWNGVSPQGWSDDGNWTAGVPGSGTVAVFDGRGSRDVTVPETSVGALKFTADGYTLSGGSVLTVASEDGAAFIGQTSGQATIASELEFASVVTVTNDAGTSLTVAGDITDGGLRKAGIGELVLAGNNSFSRQVSIGGGNTVIGSMTAVADPQKKNPLVFAGDTLWVEGDGDAETVVGPVIVRTGKVSRNTAFRNDRDVTFENFSIERGGFIKRGSGKLTIKVRDGMELAPEKRSTGLAWKYKADLADDGTVFDNPEALNGVNPLVGAFAIADGEVEFSPAEGETMPELSFSHDSLSIGMQVSDRGKARCVLDGVRASFASYLLVGYNLQKTGGIKPHFSPELCLVNGTEVFVRDFTVGRGIFYEGNRPMLVATNARIVASSVFAFSGRSKVGYESQNGNSYAVIRTKDVSLESDRFVIGQGVDARMESTMIIPENDEYAVLASRHVSDETVATHGTLLLGPGSVMKVDRFEDFGLVTNWYDDVEAPCFALAFDDARWDYGTGDYVLAADTFSKYVTLRMDGKGMRLAPRAGTVFRTEFPFTGEGGIVVDGEGTVKFAADTLLFTGTADVRSGTLDLTDAGQLGSLALDGSGTVKGGSFTATTIIAGSSLTFDDVSFGSRLSVDFGCTQEDPADPAVLARGVVIGSFTGTQPVFPSVVHGVNTGLGRVSGTVSVVGDKLVASLSKSGMVIVVR